MLKCPICGEGSEILLHRQLKDISKYDNCASHTPCTKCQSVMRANGVFLVEVDASKTTDESNPWRTGRLVAVRSAAIRKMITPTKLANDTIAKGMAYVPQEAWELLGLNQAPDMVEDFECKIFDVVQNTETTPKKFSEVITLAGDGVFVKRRADGIQFHTTGEDAEHVLTITPMYPNPERVGRLHALADDAEEPEHD